MKKIAEITICIFVIASVAYGIRYMHSFVTDYFFMNYDFSTYKRGPQVGDVIPIEKLRNNDGKSITQFYDGELILLGIVDPECGASKIAKDQIYWIYNDMKSNNINYAFTSFTFVETKEKFSEFTDSFKFKANSFNWTGSDYPPDALRKFVVPSHLLIDSKGKILGKFPGTSNDIKIREKIAKQITREVLQIKESLTPH